MSNSSSLWTTVLAHADAHADFGPGNLPYGVASRGGATFRCTRMGDFVVRVTAALLPSAFARVLGDEQPPTWNALMALDKPARVAFRDALKCVLHQDAAFAANCFPVHECEMRLPVAIGDYTDFYASRDHATNVGTMLRGKDNALQANWLHLPVGYHGRASSVVVSPNVFFRPRGQLDEGKTYGPCRRLDFELEVGVFLGGRENRLGSRESVSRARDRIFGYVLLNDWSARDVQGWEYVPLGPFCAKNFCTTISPWIIPAESLEPYKVPPAMQSKQTNPEPLPYLYDDEYLLHDVDLTVSLRPFRGVRETEICRSSLRFLYWTPAQMVAHHTSTGCNLRAGDLLGTGTISGPTPDSFGSLMELSWNGSKPLALAVDGGGSAPANANARTFLADGDTVVLRGRVRGAHGVGFGECAGMVLPSLDDDGVPASPVSRL